MKREKPPRWKRCWIALWTSRIKPSPARGVVDILVSFKARPQRKRAAGAVLGELFRYERVDKFLYFALKVEGSDRTARMLFYLLDFLAENMQNPEFVREQAAMRAGAKASPGPWPWRQALAHLSSEGMVALEAFEAAMGAQMLDAKVDQVLDCGRAGANRRALPRF